MCRPALEDADVIGGPHLRLLIHSITENNFILLVAPYSQGIWKPRFGGRPASRRAVRDLSCSSRSSPRASLGLGRACSRFDHVGDSNVVAAGPLVAQVKGDAVSFAVDSGVIPRLPSSRRSERLFPSWARNHAHPLMGGVLLPGRVFAAQTDD